MSMDVTKLKEIGKDIETKKTHSKVQPKILAILKRSTKDGDALTQKEVAEKLGKIEGRSIRPQQARSGLKALEKKGKVVRLVLPTPDETGNTVFWYSK